MVCLLGIVFFASGCGVSNSVNITFDNHDNMIVSTDVKYQESEIGEYVDLSELSPDKLKPSFDVKAKNIKIISRVEKLGKDLLGREQEGYTQVEKCKHVSWGKDFTEISFFKPQRKGESILNISNYVFFKKYKFAGKIVAPEQLIEKAKNTKFKDKANDPDSFLNASFSLDIPLQAKSIKTNSTMSETTDKNHSYFWSILYKNEEDCNVNFEFILINWFAIVITVVAIISIIGYFLSKKFNLTDWRVILKNTANGLNNLSNKEFSPQGTQTKLPVDAVTPKTEVPREEKKEARNIKKLWLIVAIVLIICATGFYFSIPKICDILIQNSITSLYEGKAEKAIQLVEVAKTLSPKNNFANDIYAKGLEEIDKNNMTNAETFMDMALKLADDKKEEFSEELTSKSISALNKKQYSKAKNLMSYAIKFDDEKPLKKKNELMQKCKNLLGAKKFDESLAYTEILALIEPKNFKYYSLKGANLYYMKKFKESVEAYTKAININNSDGLSYLGRCDSYMSLNELDKAMYDCNKSISIGGAPQAQLGQAKYNLAIIYMEKHQYRKAMDEAWSAKDSFNYAGDKAMYIKSYELFNTAADYECNYGTYCYY